jgi:hypothetical protein
VAQRPDIVLVGAGVGDTLQLTVETQRALVWAGRAFTVGVSPVVLRHLRSLGVECVDLSSRLAERRPWVEAYTEIAGFILEQAKIDPPVVLLVPGNPLLSNAMGRYVLVRARELGLHVQVLVAVSPVDTFVCQAGLDVGTFGLQVFDARRLVARAVSPNPGVPLLLLQLAGLAAPEAGTGASDDAAAYRPLTDHLARFYPSDHSVTHFSNASDGAIAPFASVPLERFAELVPQIGAGSTLFVDLVPKAGAAAGAASR